MKYLAHYVSWFTFMATLILHSPFSAHAQSDQPFRVGVILPLSGPLSEYGVATRNGIDLARQEHPELFAKVEFLWEDSQYNPKVALLAFNKLRRNNIALAYIWGNPTSEAVAPLAESSKVPLLAMALNPTVSQNRNFVIRTTNADWQFSSELAKYLSASGKKKLMVVLTENSYLRGLLDTLQKYLMPDQTLTILDTYQPSDSDFRTSVTKLRGREFDMVGVFLLSGQISQFYRQATQQRLRFASFGTDFFESTTEISQSNGAMEGAIYPHLNTTETFRKGYTTRFGNDLQIAYAGNAYDVAIVVGTLFGNSENPSSDNVIKSLRGIKDLAGVGGKFSFRETPDSGAHFEFPIRVKKIVGTKFEVIAGE